jgi:EF-P beta-lysylation protein EpmB
MSSQTDQSTWQQQLKRALSNQHSANNHNSDSAGFDAKAAQLFTNVITDQMLQLIDQSKGLDDPILAQFLPTAAEAVVTAGYSNDPVGDDQATQVPGLIHKYHGRVLLIASGSCAVNCRYCFRRHFPYSQSFAPRNGWQASLQYISNNSSIHEVILSGGDPLTLETKTLEVLSDALHAIPHIKTLRIHSRIPVVLPDRIDQEFIKWAGNIKHNKVMVLHINHAQELGPAARQAIDNLKAAGFILLNQSVLLKNINDNIEALTTLSHQLFDAGVLPYYLHQMDAVQNAAHFTVAQTRALELHQQLQSLLPGYLVPKLVKEVAGQNSKTNLFK